MVRLLITSRKGGLIIIIIYEDGSKYDGETKNNKKHGYGTFTDSEGNSNIGEFKDDKSHGYGIYIAIK